MKNKNNLTLKEMEKLLCEPSEFSALMKDDAILKLWGSYRFIQYPRRELKKLFDELRGKIICIEAGISEPTAMDKFVLCVLKRMSGNYK